MPARSVRDMWELGDEGAYLVRGRDVDPDSELAVAIDAAGTAVLAHGVDYVLRHQPALLRVGEQRAERAPGLMHHHRGAAVAAQPVLESAHQRDGQLRELE